MASNPLMRSGLEIGGDHTFDMWTAPWIMDTSPRPPRSLPELDKENWTINDFKEINSYQWNISNLHQAFDKEEISRILQVNPGGAGSFSGFSWTYKDSGMYSVKSGYKLWSSLKNQADNPVPEQKATYSIIFNKIWTLPASPKLNNFLWRCINNAVSIGEALRKRRITQLRGCSLCGDYDETLVHLFFECACARAMWSLTSFAHILSDTCCSIQGKLYSCMHLNEDQQDENKDLWIWIIWRLWKLRNAKVFQGTAPVIVAAYNMALTEMA